MSANFSSLAADRFSTAKILPPAWSGEGDNFAFLNEALGAEGAREYRELTRETSEEMFHHGLLVLAHRLESRGRPAGAAQIYSLIAKLPDPENAFATYREQAAAQLAALEGRRGGARTEQLIGGFVRHATHYQTILPMIAGSAVFQIGKNVAWARLAQAPRLVSFTGRAGAEAIAATGAFALEVSAFTSLNRALRVRTEPAASQSFSDDWVGVAFSLGVLKGAQFVGRGGVKTFGGFKPNGAPALRAAVLPQASLFLGLLAAQGLEKRADGAKWNLADGVMQALGSLVSMQVGAHLGTRLTGKSWRDFQAEIRLRAEAVPLQRLPIFEARGFKPAFNGPQVSFANQTPVERLLGALWGMGGGRAEAVPNAKAVLFQFVRNYPQLRIALASTKWDAQKSLDLLNMTLATSEQEREAILEYLPPAVAAMHAAGWSYDQQYNMIAMLASKGENLAYRIRHLRSAINAAKKFPECEEDRYRFIYELGDLAGANADRVYANLVPAVAVLRGYAWPSSLARRAFSEIIQHAGPQAGAALEFLPASFTAIMEEFWGTEKTIRIVGLLAKPASDPAKLKWRLRDGFPNALGKILQMHGPSDENYELFKKILKYPAPQADQILLHFTQSMEMFERLEWSPESTIAFIHRALDASGGRVEKVMQWSSALAFALESKYISQLEVEETILKFISQADTLEDYSVFSFVNFMSWPKRGPSN